MSKLLLILLILVVGLPANDCNKYYVSGLADLKIAVKKTDAAVSTAYSSQAQAKFMAYNICNRLALQKAKVIPPKTYEKSPSSIVLETNPFGTGY